ncbi:cytochrome P450 [Streptomyces qinglanensis]|uniref:cytochrome P450 n=1 Tax=Streptomyces qinglanensis TaxID=943816 RepID=UPI0037A9EF2C
MRLTRPRAVPLLDPADIDLADPQLYAAGDPHAVWLALREEHPVVRQPLRDGRCFWSATRYHDVNEVLRDHTRFTSERGTLLSTLGVDDPAGGKMMAASDPPVHTALREPLSRAMSARAMRRWEPRIRRMVRRLLAPLADGAPWDLAAAAASFPMAFTGTLMGLPEADWPRLTRLTTMAVAPTDEEFREGRGTLVAAHHELFEYFADHLHATRSAADDSLVGFLREMAAGDRRLRQDELVYNCYSLLLGANVTTPHAVAGTVLAFIEEPAQYARLIADPHLVPRAIEEGLRWSSPANHFMRYTTMEVELSGVRIAPGQAVVAWLGSANRDRRAFADPFAFDVARSPNRHVAFGFGPHYCVGAPLARIALRILFEETVQNVAAFEHAGPVEHLASDFVAGVKRLPVSAQLRPGAARRLSAAGTPRAEGVS